MILKSQKRKSIFSAATLAVLLAVGTPSIALAQPDRQGPPEREAVVRSQESLPQTTATGEEEQTFTTMSSESRATKEGSKSGREKAQAKVEAMRADRGTKVLSAEKREKACEKRKNGLQTKFSSIARNSESFQTRIDDIYAKALIFQTSNNLTSPELTELIAAADEAKVKASVSVAALQEAKPTTLDCKNVNVATDVAIFKVSAVQARDDLKTYKQAVKAVLKSLKTASQTTTDATETNENAETTDSAETPATTDTSTEGTN